LKNETLKYSLIGETKFVGEEEALAVEGGNLKIKKEKASESRRLFSNYSHEN
jgi:hypothetical protein